MGYASLLPATGISRTSVFILYTASAYFKTRVCVMIMFRFIGGSFNACTKVFRNSTIVYDGCADLSLTGVW